MSSDDFYTTSGGQYKRVRGRSAYRRPVTPRAESKTPQIVLILALGALAAWAILGQWKASRAPQRLPQQRNWLPEMTPDATPVPLNGRGAG